MFVVPDEKRTVNPGDVFGWLSVGGVPFYVRTGGECKREHCVLRCRCGQYVLSSTKDLRSGHKRSCGCLRASSARDRFTTHGASGTRLLGIWKHMRFRCENPSHQDYGRYGGRGIYVCDEWRCEFRAFRDWAMSSGYSDDLEIDRVDNDGPYSPANCRWATRRQQCNNKGNNVLVEAFGEIKTVQEWLRSGRCVVKKSTLWQRLKKGWHPERAMLENPHQ